MKFYLKEKTRGESLFVPEIAADLKDKLEFFSWRN